MPATLALLLLLASPGLPLIPHQSQSSPAALPRWHDSGSASASNAVPAASPTPEEDEQVGITFDQIFTSIGYNVTAVEQTDSVSGTGPAYLLNGLSNVGYWYQVGLSWNWNPGQSPGNGFDFVYETFGTSGSSIFPTNGGGGLSYFSGAVNQGDSVGLSLYFSQGDVVMLAKDWNTSAFASESYSAFGAADFVGLQTPSNVHGFFTGLMTEWYHSSPYYNNEAKVDYSNPAVTVSSAIFWADEFDPANNQIVFSAPGTSTQFQVPLLSQGFSSNGITSYGNAYDFITGYVDADPLTLGYTVVGGGTGYSSPSLSFTFNGSPHTVSYTVSSATFYVDAGSSWSLSSALPGSGPAERWESNQQTSGVVSAQEAVSVAYYNQFPLTYSFSIVGGGAPTPPTLSYSSFGSPASASIGPAAATAWADSGSAYSFTVTLSQGTLERWQTASQASGTVSASTTVDAVYYHQFSVSVSYSVAGGGSFAPPVFSYTSFGTNTSITLSSPTQSFWADSGPYSLTNPLAGSTQLERWFAPGGQGTISGAGAISIVYEHQFYFSVTGAVPASQWFDSGSTATVIVPGVSGRSAGTGQRIASYSIDGGAATSVSPTTGNVTVSIQMNSPHSVAFTSVFQVQVAFGVGASQALASITPPTIAGDDYWYDSGSAVNVALLGVWGRVDGSGSRLTSYSVDGGSQVQTATTGDVNVLSIASLSSPQTIDVQTVSQYLLTTSGGSVVSLTPPSIPGDQGWYDAATHVNVIYNYSWDAVANQSRQNAVAYTLDGGQNTTLPRSGTGTFMASVVMSEPEAIGVQAVTQYHFAVSGGSDVKLSAPSPTNDGFYDAGSSLTATTDYTWDVVPNTSRQNLVGYTLDATTQSVTREDSGNFSTPAIQFDTYHSLTFDSVTQLYVSFSFTKADGSSAIVPTSFSISTQGGVQPVPGFKTWLDNGTSFTVASLLWEGVDVKPTNATYDVGAGLSPTIRARVYDATLKVTDYLGIPVSGASAEITLANGTQISATTGSDGTVVIPEIPLGTFSASIKSLGVTTQVLGDASTQSVTIVHLPISYPTLGVIGVALVVLVGLVVGLRSRKSRARKMSSGTAANSNPPS
jgi:hypothetical protein